MKTFNNELVIHRGETFSMDKVVQNKDGSPYIVSNKLKNPYVLVAVSTTRYDQNKRYLLNLWLPLTDKVRFSITDPIDLTSFKTEANGTVSKYTSFNDVNVRGPVPGSGGKNCIVSGYIGDRFVFYDYDDCVLYLENEQGIKEYRYWNLEQEGLLNTRESHINAAIKEFKQYYRQGYNINDKDLQERVLSKYKLSNLTTAESRRIAREVGR